MRPDQNQIVELPSTVEEIRAKLSLAAEKWRESGVMLCKLRREVADSLVLKTTLEKMIEDLDSREDPLSTEAEQRPSKISSARTLPSSELRRIFVRVNHLVNFPIAKQGMAEASLLLPSPDAVSCLHCGLPLPLGKRKFCSEQCKKNYAKGIRYPGAEPASDPRSGSDLEPEGEPTPEPGLGYRNMECRYSESCSALATLEDWDGFHCETCDLKGPQEQLVLGRDLH